MKHCGYILASFNDNSNNIVIITGIPVDLVRRLGIRIIEIRETSKNLVLTNDEFEKLKNVKWLDSIGQVSIKLKLQMKVFFQIKYHLIGMKIILVQLLYLNWTEINLNPNNLPLYEIITEYEKNKLTVNNGQIIINDIETKSYTFKQDYYWMRQ